LYCPFREGMVPIEKKKGKWYGSCYECGHARVVEAGDEPVIMCIPKNDLMSKYEKGCPYLIPRCEHTDLDSLEEKVPRLRKSPIPA
jgi:hypothetical protein